VKKYLLCSDGSYMQLRHVFRFSVGPEGTRFAVRAHVAGPALPYPVLDFADKESAQHWLNALIRQLEDDCPKPDPWQKLGSVTT
jgi:hypothetical protein